MTCAICGRHATGPVWGHQLCPTHWTEWQTVPLPPSLQTGTVEQMRAYLARGDATSVEWQTRTDAWVKAQRAKEKPEPLMVELVELFTDPDEVILDPYTGSGTTGVACLRLGRRFIGIEKDERYAAIARERLLAESQGLTLRAARAGQLPMFPGGQP